MKKITGFSLVELVITMILVSILIGVSSVIISGPLKGYADTAAQMEFIELSDIAMTRVTREIRNALPNSVRVKSTGLSLELVPIVAGFQYRNQSLDAVGASSSLNFSASDEAYYILDAYSALQNSMQKANSSDYFLVVYNMPAYQYTNGVLDYDKPLAGLNFYNSSTIPAGGVLAEGSHVSWPIDTLSTTSDVDETAVTMTSVMQFSLQSPDRRMYLVSNPVSYVCDLTEGTLRRYSEYGTHTIQPASSSDFNNTGALLLSGLKQCNFIYDPGSAMRSGVVTIEFTMNDGLERSLYLMQQMQVKNAS